MLCCHDVEILNFLKRERQNKEREKDKDRERSALCWTGSKSRQLPGPGESLLSTSFLRFQFQQQTTHPLFQKALVGRAGGKGGKGWLKSVVLRRGGRLRRPAAAAFRLPPPFFLSRVQLARVFF